MAPLLASTTSRWPHRWAWLLACATFPLVWWGGFVTATGSGMAFRGWLNADGVFMPFYPWFSTAGDKFIEHGHRVLGMLGGVLTIALVVSTLWSEPRRWVRRFSLAMLAGVIAQGVLGGLRVVLDERMLALLHGCTGPLFFAAAAAMVAVTSARWTSAAPAASTARALAPPKLLRLALATVALAYLQLVMGAVVRHSPHMLTEEAPTIFRLAVYSHVLLAVVVVAQILALTFACRVRGRLPAAVAAMALLVLVQVALGLTTWLVKYGMPRWAGQAFGEWSYRANQADLATAAIVAGHGAIGALIVALSVVAALWIARERTPSWRPASAAPPLHAPGAVA